MNTKTPQQTAQTKKITPHFNEENRPKRETKVIYNGPSVSSTDGMHQIAEKTDVICIYNGVYEKEDNTVLISIPNKKETGFTHNIFRVKLDHIFRP